MAAARNAGGETDRSDQNSEWLVARACALIEKDEFVEALEMLLEAAEAGNPEAEFILGYLCDAGLGVLPDMEMAAGYYSRAAEKGHRGAQNNLGNCYFLGQGMPQDFSLAMTWYMKAAHQGLADAQVSLAYLLSNRIGVDLHSRDSQQLETDAFNWISQAAAQGHMHARLLLATHYDKGIGTTSDPERACRIYRELARESVPQGQYRYAHCLFEGIGTSADPAEAVLWLRKAAEQDLPEAAALLGIFYRRGQELEQDFEQAQYWLEKAVSLGDSDSMVHLGSMYAQGDLPHDYEKAYRYFHEAALRGNPYAFKWLGDCYWYGKGVEQDLAEALKWQEKAAHQGDDSVQYDLAVDLAYRLHPPNYERAVYWFRRAADQGHIDAQVKIGFMYSKGLGVEQDYVQAVDWFMRAASRNNMNAINNLGDAYYYGLGVEQDYAEAFRYLSQAAMMGQPDALFLGGTMLTTGLGVRKNTRKGKSWIRRAAEAGHPLAMVCQS